MRFLDDGNPRRHGWMHRKDMPSSNKCALRLSNRRNNKRLCPSLSKEVIATYAKLHGNPFMGLRSVNEYYYRKSYLRA